MRPDLLRFRDLRRMPGFDAVLAVAARLSTAPQAGAELLALGSTSYEPWHLVAHLRDTAQWGTSVLPPPTLVRHAVPDGAPPQLAVDLSRLRSAGRHATVLVVTPDDLDELTLEHLADARRRGGTVLAVGTDRSDCGDLKAVTHELAAVAPASFDVAQHVLPAAAGISRPDLLSARRLFPVWRPQRLVRS